MFLHVNHDHVQATQNRTFSVMNDGLDYLIKPKGLKSKRYIFYLSLNEEGVNKIPAVKKLALNKAILCDDTIKAEKLRRQLNVCGRRTLEHSELSSVRTYAKAGDWPWHVALLLKDITTNTSQYRCGGNIISTTAVLTAGHCLSINGFTVEPSRVIIIAGVSNITDMNQLGRQERIATRIIIHPAFIHEQATSDLAIVKVEDFRFTQYVQPICVWGPLYDKSSLFGQEAVVVGFGLTEDNKFSDTLRSAYTMVQNDSTCIAYSPILYNGLLNEFTFCAGFGPASGINPRNGDSGGGLVVAKAHPDYQVTWFLRGVVSHCGITPNQKECDPKFYHVYTDVGPHYGWIYHNIQPRARQVFRVTIGASAREHGLR
ncbi:venom protease-like [Battus philenor]|uniref:venom protease-like n=1 Tax=Battus philenor TaxID=42288 RepID=UPI0035CF102C